MKKLSVVVPVYFNEGSLAPLHTELRSVEQELAGLGLELELIFVDDGSGDGSFAELVKIKAARPATRITRHLFSNIVVTVESATEASSVCQIVLYAGAAAETGVAKSDPPLVGAFEDRFVKRDGRWLFLSRKGSLALKAE